MLIGQRTFQHCSNICNPWTLIGQRTFQHCSNICNPSMLIGRRTFQHCSNITQIVLCKYFHVKSPSLDYKQVQSCMISRWHLMIFSTENKGMNRWNNSRKT
jgi:hypothetical protein